MQYVIIIVAIVVICLIALVLKKIFIKDPATDVATVMITSGVGLVVSTFPGIREAVVAIIASFTNIEVCLGTEPLAIIAGFLLI